MEKSIVRCAVLTLENMMQVKFMNNRELKFRVWLVKEQKMIYPSGALRLVGRNGAQYNLLEQTLEEHKNEDYDGDFRCKIQQYTGLKDKNGKEIYEGDRLKHYPGFGCTWDIRESEVVFNECSFWEKHNGVSFVLSDRDQELEIIGNIFEASTDGH